MRQIQIFSALCISLVFSALAQAAPSASNTPNITNAPGAYSQNSAQNTQARAYNNTNNANANANNANATNNTNAAQYASQTANNAPATQEKFAESSAGFLGLYASFGEMKYSSYANSDYSASHNYDTSASNSAASIGVRGGKKYFFSKYFGAKIYVDFENIHHASSAKDESGEQSAGASMWVVAANVDLLVNFLYTKNFGFGIFAGAGAGYQMMRLESNSTRQKINDFYADAKAGLRVASKNMGAEFGVKMPFVGIERKYTAYVNGSQVLDMSQSIKQGLPKAYIALSFYF